MDSQPTILIVDADRALLGLLGREMDAAGLAAILLRDSSRTFDAAVQKQPDLIVLEHDMPESDGREILRDLKRDPRTQQIPVLIHSDSISQNDRRAALELGADDCLDKPFEPSLLVRRIIRRVEQLHRVPRSRADIDRRQAEILRSEAHGPRSHEAGTRSRTSEKAPILVVEDDEDIREAICEVLADEGVATVAAGNGQDALELLRRLSMPPSLILMDLMMPIMDGWELHRRIAGDDSLSRTPVIVMSAHPRDQQLPAVAWLQKPLGVDELLSTIREAVPS